MRLVRSQTKVVVNQLHPITDTMVLTDGSVTMSGDGKRSKSDAPALLYHSYQY
jgi:hypothetical protein